MALIGFIVAIWLLRKFMRDYQRYARQLGSDDQTHAGPWGCWGHGWKDADKWRRQWAREADRHRKRAEREARRWARRYGYTVPEEAPEPPPEPKPVPNDADILRRARARRGGGERLC